MGQRTEYDDLDEIELTGEMRDKCPVVRPLMEIFAEMKDGDKSPRATKMFECAGQIVELMGGYKCYQANVFAFMFLTVAQSFIEPTEGRLAMLDRHMVLIKAAIAASEPSPGTIS